MAASALFWALLWLSVRMDRRDTLPAFAARAISDHIGTAFHVIPTTKWRSPLAWKPNLSGRASA